MDTMIGERLRGARQSQGRSLADVAEKVNVSVATLSRIENDKQSVDVGLFLQLAQALNTPAQELLTGATEEANGADPLVRRITALDSSERTNLWLELAAERRAHRSRRGAQSQIFSQHVEELVAQVEFLREELEAVRKVMRKRR